MDMRVECYKIISQCFLILLLLAYVMPQSGVFEIKHVQDPLQDWSKMCKDNATLSVFLTSNMGQSDSEVVLISGNRGSFPNCTVMCYTAANVVTILVFEFPDAKLYNRPVDCDGISLRLVENNNTTAVFDACQAVKRSNLTYASMFSSGPLVTLTVNSDRYFQPLKLTMTTTRILKLGEQCDPETEVACVRHQPKSILLSCVTIEVKCDGHINCGTEHENDESEWLCKESSMHVVWLVILLTIVLFVIVSFFIIRFIRRIVPQVGTNFFVFNEDEDNRLNLASVFTQPTARGRGAQLSSSSYRFRTSSVHIRSPEREERRTTQESGKSDLSPKDSEVEVRSEFPNSERRKSSASSRRRGSTKEPQTDAAVPQLAYDNKRSHVHIATVSVEVDPDYNEARPQEIVTTTEIPPKSILGHGHDGIPFPEYRGPRMSIDAGVVNVHKKKKGLKDVRSSKDLISRKVHHGNAVAGTKESSPKPERSHRESSSDSD